MRTLALGALVATVAFLFGASGSAASLAFEDEFDGRSLGPGWTWQNPAGTSSYSLGQGHLYLHVAAMNDQWVGVDRAPRLLRPQPPAPYTVEVRFAGSLQGGNSFAGIVVFRDGGHWLLGGWLGDGTMEFSGVVGGAPTWPIGVAADRYGWLRVRKGRANPFGGHFSYYFDASPDGLNWTNLNVYHDYAGVFHDPSVRVGIMAKNWNAVGAPYTLAVAHYREYADDLMPSALSDYINAPATTKISQLTGPGSPGNGPSSVNANVCGTDLGIPFTWQGRTYFVFGDTKGCGQRPDYRPNALAFSYDMATPNGPSLDGWVRDQNLHARDIVPTIEGLTAIPTGAVAVGAHAFIYVMEVSSWDDEAGVWSCSFTSIASAHANDPSAWTYHYPAVTWEAGNFSQIAVLRDASTTPATLYLYGTPCGRFGAVKLARVLETDVLVKDAYTYLSGFAGAGQPVWSPFEQAAITVAGGPAGELSVRYNSWLGRYIMTTLDVNKRGIVVRESPTPWGPWGAPVVVARGADFPQLYGAFVHPTFEENGGETIYYTLSRWGPYNVFWMRTQLVRRPH